jgi:abortive infection bacteriophage resistance protein
MSKMPLSYQAQLDLFKSRGLIVNNEAFALHCLAHHNYYRLSAYRFPFTVQGDPDSFLPDTTFEQIWQLYDFDRGLRKLIIEACKRVEISVRSRWAYEIGHQLGPQAYEDARNFPKFRGHAKTMQKLDEEMSRSHELFVQHYQKKYNTTRPEVWVTIEVASFGTISKLLKHTAPPRLRQDIADTYRLDEKTLCSLFHHLSILRNTAAQHSRTPQPNLEPKVHLFTPAPQEKASRALSQLPRITKRSRNTHPQALQFTRAPHPLPANHRTTR